jgi:hypothetical protein
VKSNGLEIYESIRDVVFPGILTVTVLSTAAVGSSLSSLNPGSSVTDALK